MLICGPTLVLICGPTLAGRLGLIAWLGLGARRGLV
jgi:hypothetical protein